MSNSLAVVDPDTRIGALKQEAHRSIMLAATGGGLTFAWLAHLMAWTPLGFTIHGVAGALGGYFIGSGVSRALLGVRSLGRFRGLERVPLRNRIIASTERIGLGGAFFFASYLWAVGVTLPALAESLAFLTPAVMVTVLFVSFFARLGR